MSDKVKPFWEAKTLEEMSPKEWDQLCDRCGLCCLVRVQDEDSSYIYDTSVVCRHYDCEKKQCSAYSERTAIKDGCVRLTPELVRQFDWLPNSCAYRKIMRGDPLPATHPLISKSFNVTRTVVDIFEPIGLLQNNDDIEPENYLIVREDLGY